MKRLTVSSFSTVFQIAVIILLFNYPVPSVNNTTPVIPSGNNINIIKPTETDSKNKRSNIPAAQPVILEQGPILSFYNDFQNSSTK